MKSCPEERLVKEYYGKMKKIFPIFLFSLLCLAPGPSFGADGFTAKDRELLIELRTRMDLIDKRFEELREDMNKRFEQVDKRFEQMMQFMGILAAIFTAMTVGVFAFAWWDRRTVIRKSTDEA